MNVHVRVHVTYIQLIICQLSAIQNSVRICSYGLGLWGAEGHSMCFDWQNFSFESRNFPNQVNSRKFLWDCRSSKRVEYLTFVSQKLYFQHKDASLAFILTHKGRLIAWKIIFFFTSIIRTNLMISHLSWNRNREIAYAIKSDISIVLAALTSNKANHMKV